MANLVFKPIFRLLCFAKTVLTFTAKNLSMKFVKTLLFLFAILISGTIFAQDIHWTMFNMSPLTLNPANTGAYEGSFRIGGIYRDQWNSISGADGFNTPSLYVDAPLIRGFRKNDWVGIGIVTVNDKAGSANLRTQGSLLTAAYHASLDRRGKNVLTLGIQAGSITRRLDQERLLFADDFDQNLILQLRA